VTVDGMFLFSVLVVFLLLLGLLRAAGRERPRR